MGRDKIKQGLLGAAGGAIVLAIVGFTWGGWVSGNTAQQMAATASEKAVVDRLASICVAQYNQDPEKVLKLKKLKDSNSWSRFEYVGKQGWSTMPGEKDPDNSVSRECANLLTKVTG